MLGVLAQVGQLGPSLARRALEGLVEPDRQLPGQPEELERVAMAGCAGTEFWLLKHGAGTGSGGEAATGYTPAVEAP